MYKTCYIGVLFGILGLVVGGGVIIISLADVALNQQDIQSMFGHLSVGAFMLCLGAFLLKSSFAELEEGRQW